MNAGNGFEPGTLPQELAGNVLSLRQVWAILWSGRYIIPIVTLVVGVSTAAVTLRMPRAYESTATLLVALNVSAPVAGEQSTIFSNVATQIEFMMSPLILTPVVEAFGLTQRPDYMLGYSGDGSAESLSRWAVSAFRYRLRVNMGQGSSFMYVTAEDPDPAMAARLANGVADAFVAEQERRFRDPAKERAERSAAQIEALKVKVDEAQARVAQFRKRSGLLDLNSGGGGIESARLFDLDGRLAAARTARQAAELRLSRIGQGEAGVMNSALVQRLKDQLQQKQARLTELSGSLGARHPQIVALQSEIDLAGRELEKELAVHSTGAADELRSARVVEAQIESELRQQRQLVLSGRAKQDEAAQLLSELASATKIYESARDAQQRTELSTEMALRNVTIVQRAAPALRPLQRKARKLTMLALIASAGAATGLVFLYELLNRRVRCRDDIEKDLRLPVLVELRRA